MSFSIWQGEKIKLRAVETKDITLFEMFDDETERNVDCLHFPRSHDGLKAWLEQELPRKRDDDSFRWIAENQDGSAIGTMDTFACNRRNGTFKYGIAIAKPFWGQGYAKEMILLVLKYYFLELGYQKVTPHVYSFNDRSLKLHQSLGFKREGCLRNMIYTNGKYYDEIHFGMTRLEYEQLYGRVIG